MYQHYREIYFWCLTECPLYGGNFYGVLYWERPLIEVQLYYETILSVCVDFRKSMSHSISVPYKVSLTVEEWIPPDQ